MERKLKKGIIPKYLDFFTYLYDKKFFSISRELRDYQIDSYVKDALIHYNFIKGKGHNYKWIGNQPTIEDFDKIWEHRKKLRNNTRSTQLKKQAKSATVTQQSALFISEERAVEVLKSLGYKLFKPVTEFQEI